MIATEDPARRLARAIVSDIRLYHAQRIAEGQDMSEPIDEGRQLFRSRVDPALHPVFEQVLGELLAPEPPPRSPDLLGIRPDVAPRASTRSGAILAAVAILVVAVAAAAWFLLAR